MTIISTTVGRNPLEEMDSHHGQQKSPKCSTWMQSQKGQNGLCPFPKQMVIQVYAPTSNAEEAEVEWFYEDLQDLTNTRKRCPFHYRGLECKRKKSRNTWSIRQICPWRPGQRPIEFCQENALVIANTIFQQHERRLYTWTSPDGQHQNQIDYILCIQRWRSSIQSAKTRPGADCGSDHELLIAKFRLKLKKVGITSRSFK